MNERTGRCFRITGIYLRYVKVSLVVGTADGRGGGGGYGGGTGGRGPAALAGRALFSCHLKTQNNIEQPFKNKNIMTSSLVQGHHSDLETYTNGKV